MLPPTDRLIRYERLVAPREHQGVLVEPPAGMIRPRPPQPAHSSGAAPPFPFEALRSGLRAELGLSGAVILTGHQPEFFHAGVFAKNLAAAALAEQLGGAALFLTVDTDVPKSSVLRVPQATPAGLRRVEVPIPGVATQTPYVSQPRVPRDRWLAFFAQIGALHAGVGDSLLGAFAKGWIEAGGATPDYCEAFTYARTASEARLGLSPLRELRETALARTTAFHRFFAHIAVHAATFAEHHNAAQAAFRKRHKVRAKGRPVPPLRIARGRIELPFWIVPQTGPERQRMHLFVEWRGSQAAFFAEDELAFTCDRAALEACADTLHGGWEIWPRALTLSAFARMLLADLFIHGIGGAMYDEVGEDFMRSFFGVELAPMCCVTATIHLPLPLSAVTPDDLRLARHTSRDLRYNPQRYVRNAPAELLNHRQALIRKSDELRTAAPKRRSERRLVFREIRRVNAQILESDAWCAAHHDQRIDAIEAQLTLDRVALDREYFYALHSLESLRALRATLAVPCHMAEATPPG